MSKQLTTKTPERLIVIYEICQISRKKSYFAKSMETFFDISLFTGSHMVTVINKIFKFPPYLDSFVK